MNSSSREAVFNATASGTPASFDAASPSNIVMLCLIGAVAAIAAAFLAVGWRYALPPRDEPTSQSSAAEGPSSGAPAPRLSVAAFTAVVQMLRRRQSSDCPRETAAAALPRPSESPPMTRNPALSMSGGRASFV
jgi:hypothetical protein